MTVHLSRRGLGAALLSLAAAPVALAAAPPAPTAPAPVPATPTPEAPGIFDLIRVHRDALVKERRAMAEVDSGTRLCLPGLPELRAERDALRKARHSARRALRRATPRTERELRALAIYYESLVPSPDPQDVEGTCLRDLDAARARMAAQRGFSPAGL